MPGIGRLCAKTARVMVVDRVTVADPGQAMSGAERR
jgi:hypothetical protein